MDFNKLISYGVQEKERLKLEKVEVALLASTSKDKCVGGLTGANVLA